MYRDFRSGRSAQILGPAPILECRGHYFDADMDSVC